MKRSRVLGVRKGNKEDQVDFLERDRLPRTLPGKIEIEGCDLKRFKSDEPIRVDLLVGGPIRDRSPI